MEVLQLDHLAKQLRAKRFKGGSIGFDRPEVRFDIDEKGHPVSTYVKIAKDANKLVEEFMLLANRSVAEHVAVVPKGKQPKVLPYRIHDVPDPESSRNCAASWPNSATKCEPKAQRPTFPTRSTTCSAKSRAKKRRTSWNSWHFAP